jgi:hypothetical protein
MSWQVQEKDGRAVTGCNGCRSTSQSVLSFEKDTVIEWLYLSSLKIEEGDIPIKPPECNKGYFSLKQNLFYWQRVTKEWKVAMLWCSSLSITRYVTDLVKMSQILLMCTKVKWVTITGVTMEWSASFFFKHVCLWSPKHKTISINICYHYYLKL